MNNPKKKKHKKPKWIKEEVINDYEFSDGIYKFIKK